MKQVLHSATTHLREPTLDEKVAFLRRPQSYSSVTAIEAIETHMSWVFLTHTHAYKLKKPTCTGPIDYRRLRARLLNCRRELGLNRRLAPTVYLGLAALRAERDGRLRLGGSSGRVVDWLVVMRRLPEDKTLRNAIVNGRVARSDLHRLIERLAAFFAAAAPAPTSASRYRERIENGIRRTHASLLTRRLSHARLNRIAGVLFRFVHDRARVLGARAKRVIEGHGDLRPEHIYLLDEPQIIDCLEFSRELRLLDPLEEIAFLAMECEYLGAADIGRRLLADYADIAADRVEPALIDFHMCRSACLRAALVLSHLDDPDVASPRKWQRRARRYLAIAAMHAHAMAGPLRHQAA